MKVFRLWSNLFCLFCFVGLTTSAIIKWQCKMIILMRILNVIIFTYRSQRLPLMLINVHIISLAYIYIPANLLGKWTMVGGKTLWLVKLAMQILLQAHQKSVKTKGIFVTGSSEKCKDQRDFRYRLIRKV